MHAASFLDALLLGAFGLLIGSFLNVAIFRLPKMLERQWKNECAEMTGGALEQTERFNLMVPRSRCPSCNHQIRWFENVPVVSYVFLRGKCSACGTGISWRYPLVELANSALFAYCGWRWGATATGAAYCLLSAALLTAALIDWDTTLLPDDITLPLIWAGLIAASMGWTTATLSDAVWGAIAGYMCLWLIFWGFKLLTGKEGMGYGDFKLLAALGAWFGWTSLIQILLMSSVIGACVGIVMKFSSGLREGGYMPFGPFLAGAGLFSMVAGSDAMLRFVGL
ncbi:MAG: hypothetical protein RLZZ591_1355 [Pseudomonadota bacterium]|jgi:leader peptidase (prepilin peptidase)/N-methyltransferase